MATNKKKKQKRSTKKQRPARRKQSRLKLPNGFGSITKRTDKPRRKPFEVRKWFTDAQAQKVIGWFATYEEALAFLVEYNKDPSVYQADSITFEEAYNLMAAERYPKIAAATANNYKAAYKQCTELYSMKIKDIKLVHLQRVIQTMSENNIGYASQKKCKQLFHMIWNYVIKYDLIANKQDITDHVEIDRHTKKVLKQPFNTRQLGRIQKLIGADEELSDYARCVVMMCYCGCRPTEFVSIERQDVKIKQRYFVVRESKTEAGRNRAVPISKKALEHYQYFMNKKVAKGVKKLIVDDNGKELNYAKFRAMFDRVMKASNCKHTPHECRHTCATWLDNAGANDVATKKILGHVCQGVTKGVYTHKTLSDLKKAIDLL